MLLEPGFTSDDFRPDGIRNPAVTFAQQTDEIGPAAFNFGQAEGEHLTLVGLGLGDAPAQFHLGEGDETVGALPAQFGEDLLHEQVPL